MGGPTALVLAGGLGTRIRAAVSDRPKALAPIGGRPFVGYLLEYLAWRGVRRAVLCTGYQADAVEQALGVRYAGVDLAYSREDAPLGTGGALRKAAHLVESEAALVVNGDSLCEVDLDAMGELHRARHASATLLLTRHAAGRAFGTVGVSEGGAVVSFREKTEGSGSFVNAGVYMLSREVIEAI